RRFDRLTASRSQEPLTLRTDQPECVSQRHRRTQLSSPEFLPFQVLDRPQRNLRQLRQLLLGQSGVPPTLPDQVPELDHRTSSPELALVGTNALLPAGRSSLTMPTITRTCRRCQLFVPSFPNP